MVDEMKEKYKDSPILAELSKKEYDSAIKDTAFKLKQSEKELSNLQPTNPQTNNAPIEGDSGIPTRRYIFCVGLKNYAK